ncbi:MAG: cysteine peptidase family C39 domain-containing protein, partial [Planctomycetota bacterium]
YLELFETPFSYHHSNDVDTDSLLQESILNKLKENSHTNNCATVAVKYAALKFGNEISDSNLAQLINKSDETTSLHSMKDLLQENGLHCLAVQTDIQTLKNFMQNYQVILHLPDINHYVVLQDVDDKYVWLVDLNRKRFFYRKKIKEFSADWDKGTALLISKEPINIQGQVSNISDEELNSIIGSDGIGNYSCSKVIQQGDVVFCSKVGWLCGGRYSYYLIRYGCEPDENGGDCFGEPMISKVSWTCINKPSDPLMCSILGDPVSFYIRACQ